MQTSDVPLGYLARAEGEGPVPGVVMIHDVWGLAEHTRDLARRLAGEGFAVLALDLYRRLPQVQIGNPGAWMRDLSDPQVLADIREGLNFLSEHPATRGRKLGVTGFCMGGMYALLAACELPGVAASVAYYGLLSHEHGILHDPAGLDPAKKPRQPLAAAAGLRCPLLAFYGDRDEFVPEDDIRRLREVAPSAQVTVYPGAGQAFMNDTREDAYEPEIAARAWAAMLAFFRKELV